MSTKFRILGKGFIYPKHKFAIKSVGGEIVEKDEDYVVILTPNHLHYKMILENKGKKILCEKPLVLNLEDLKKIENQPDIFTVFQLRYHPKIQKLKKIIKKNEFYLINLYISVQRDEEYLKSWKGDIDKSG